MTGGIVRWALITAALLAGGSARAQAGAQPPAPPPPPAAPTAPGSQSTAGSQGQSSTAQPSSPGASSQQVVVNPPQPVPPPAPPSSTTVVNPPPPAATSVYAQPYGDVAVVERRERPNPLGTVALDAGYGGVAGLLVGGGVALVQQGDNWGRDLMVGAGIGLIVGAAVGVAHAVYEQQQYDRATRRAAAATRRDDLVAGDGLNRTDRDPVVTAATVGLALKF
jgi:hypothetical protein